MTIISFWSRKTPGAAKSLNHDRAITTSGNRGFSLVEVSIALGVFAFAILAVFGLLGVAISTSKDTQQDSTLASIIRTLDADIRSATDSTSVEALRTSTRYYDIVGKPVPASAAYYTVTLTHSNVSAASQQSISTLMKVDDTSKLFVWSARIVYPYPANVMSLSVILSSQIQ